ncbi:ligand-binding sensor domain-containing protein [Carboxylicivirga marina]|uniref:Two component regulator three Y domain-containing protein n=1 Tax=Carboxylicivirga marina TaxID=2800988 RepID=A0ABS1HE48_9BACT|nr:two-component regulator propeller domain-containing protein [Carboxylicivirga marina]MBK3515946.1 hypothetical protein [Carboxylicivirga marina]
MNARKLLSVVVCVVVYVTAFSNDSDLKFRHLTVDHGLSHNGVKSIIKDSQGFIWIGTFAGLNRYDGYEFQSIHSYGDGDLLLSSDNINCLYEDSKKNIWIGTLGGGLNRLNSIRDSISYFYHKPGNNSISSNNITDILEDEAGIIWIATRNGLNKYDPENNTFEVFNTSNGLSNAFITSLAIEKNVMWVGTYGGGVNLLNMDSNSILKIRQLDNVLGEEEVLDIVIDQNKFVWMAIQDKGLCRFNQYDKQCKQFYGSNDIKGFHENDTPRDLVLDNKNRIWFTSNRSGLFCYDQTIPSFFNYKLNQSEKVGVNSCSLSTILIDDIDNLWVGSYRQGLSICKMQQDNIIHLDSDDYGNSSMRNNDVNSIFEDSDGDIWLATENGLSRLDGDFNNTRTYTTIDGLVDNTIMTISEINNELWLGTYAGGINIFNKELNVFRSFETNQDQLPSLSSDFVRTIYKDSKGLIWIGTIRGGINVYNPKTQEIVVYAYSSDKIKPVSSNNIFSFIEDKDGSIYVATNGGGVMRYNRKKDEFTAFMFRPFDDNSLSNNMVRCQLIDSKGVYWAGSDYGLNEFNPNGEIFTSYYKEDGLASNSIVGLTEDDHQNLWITTQHGISIFNLNTRLFTHFFVEDGLQSNVFNYNAIVKLRNGNIVCGSDNGIEVIDGDNQLEAKKPKPVVITGLSILNQKINHGIATDGRQIYKGELSKTKQLNLSHKDKILELSYSNLEYLSTKLINYQYKIDELHDEWIDLGNKNRISFHNLKPDDYTLKIKSIIANRNLESEETVLYIKIKPPFSTSPWLYVIIVLAVVSIAFVLYFYDNQINQKSKNEIES